MNIFSYGIGGASTRTKVVGRVYIADVALPDHNISFHHEMYHMRLSHRNGTLWAQYSWILERLVDWLSVRNS
ncbi:hypothetical protein R6Q59_017219 [Mikania micrantha]